ncbi:MAG: DUF4139 domain-containing protein [Planctomycetaceae bacterium]|nr:DUF4139 domain-containing protein [Planctomycetaceae bacterium]
MSRRLGWCAVLSIVAFAAVVRAEGPQPGNLPLNRVILFSSGVGFFEHAGQVKDDAKIEMKFKTDQINDLLKSMVVQDLDGGHVSTITYASKDPISKTLEGFSIDLRGNPTLAQLLQQVRGERVVVEAPSEVSGIILGVETRKRRLSEHETIDADVLNVLTEGGLRAIPLDSVSRIKLANQKLDAELRKALSLLASAHATDKKLVELNFLGKGARRVRVGYIQASPIWKTTYRLVLADDRKPFLQGWAIVENTSEEDWRNVRLTLVSGRPISFTMDLYEPLYLERPQENLELYASLRPETYNQDLDKKEAMFCEKAKASREPASPSDAMRKAYEGDGKRAQMQPAQAVPAADSTESLYATGGRWEVGRGVQSAAQGGNVGNLFQYAIALPVSLPRQQSAMLPIVNAEVKGEKVSIYNPAVQAEHPLYGLRFTNTTDLYLMQGPVTVFDGSVYAGDAKIEDLPPGSERLISYGLDLDTEVAQQGKAQPEELLSVRLLKGTMITARKFTRSVEYTVKNSAKHVKNVLIEMPIDPSWTLVEPKKPTERSRNMYRFAVVAKLGEPAKLTVAQARSEQQHVAITNLDDGTIRFYLSAKVVSEPVKAALAKIAQRKHEIEQVAGQRQQLEVRTEQIANDQNRIRQNMAYLDHQSDVYKRYVKKFSDQETEVEKLRGQSSELAEKEIALRKSLDEYLMGLDAQ